jgi:hypothetical protein
VLVGAEPETEQGLRLSDEMPANHEELIMHLFTLTKASPLLRAAIAAAVMLAWSAPAHAYLDPATGSVLLQGLLAGIAGLMVVLRLYWGRLKAFFRRCLGRQPIDPAIAEKGKQ